MRAAIREKIRSIERRPLVLVLAVLVLAFLQRCLTLGVLAWGIGPSKLISALMTYDSMHYKKIVDGGYHLAGEGGEVLSNLAFFPLYPLVAKVFTILPGVSATSSMLVLAFVGSVLAALPIFAIGRHLHGVKVGVILILLWGASPQSFVLVMAYSEGWFTLATAWTLLFMMRRRPLAAAVAVLIAGLLRPAAVPLVLVVVIWCAIEWFRDREHGRRWVVAAIVAPLGVGSFVVYTAWRMKDLLGYFTIQKQWNLQMSAPWAFLGQMSTELTTGNPLLISVDLYVPIILGYVALLVLLMGQWREKDHGWMSLYVLLASLLILSRTTYFWSESRQFLPLFPLLLPLARITSNRWAWLVVLLGLTMITASFGAHFLTVLEYSP